MNPTITLRELDAIAERDPDAAQQLLVGPARSRHCNHLPLFVADDGKTVIVTAFEWKLVGGKPRLFVSTKEWRRPRTLMFELPVRVKYPRTPHLPWSPGASCDDRVAQDLSGFVGEEVVVSVKMDGEGVTIESGGGMYARSTTTRSAPWRSRTRALAARVGPLLPRGWRICGEDVSVQHSIAYEHLPAHFLVFSIWTDQNEAVSWSETEVWAALLELTTVPVLYRGPWDEKLVRSLYRETFDGDPCEGYVVRLARPFSHEAFGSSVAKYVRARHVQTSERWDLGPFIENRLRSSGSSCGAT